MSEGSEIWKRLDHLRSIRNNFLKCIEKVVGVLNILLIVLTSFLVFTGIKFINYEMWSTAQSAMNDLKQYVVFWVALNAITVTIFAFSGILIAKKRSINKWILALWGCGNLVVIGIPVLAESMVYINLLQLSMKELKDLCELKTSEVQDKHGHITSLFMGTAHEFDHWSETILDEYMCTKEACPCLNYKTGHVTTQMIFMSHPERVNKHGRTFFEEQKFSEGRELTYMYFTKEEEGEMAYRTMRECLDNHDFASSDDIKIKDPAGHEKIDNNGAIEQVTVYMKNKLDLDKQKQKQDMLREQIKGSLEFYLNLEDTWGCSGMCKPALFYFGRTLDHGPPVLTCLTQFRQHFKEKVTIFISVSTIVAVTAMLNFISHFCLYNRPLPEQQLVIDHELQSGANMGPQLVAPNSERAAAVEMAKYDAESDRKKAY